MSNAQVKIREQLDILIALQTATNAKLDALLLASTPPTGNNTTLADVVQALNAIHADTMSMDERLSLQRALLSQLVNNLGIPVGDATTTVAGRLTALQNLTAALVDNLGIPVGDATTTVAGRLTAIQNLLSSPSAGAVWFPAGADDRTVSNFNIANAGGSFDSLWVWSFDLGDGSTVTLAPPGTSATGANSEFLQASGWAGWQFYAACGATPIQEVFDLQDGSGSVIRDVVANRWHDVTTGPGIRGWRKPGLDIDNGAIQALYLKPPADGGGFGPGTSSGGPF